MSTHTRTRHRMPRHHVVAGPRSTRHHTKTQDEAIERNDAISAFVRRTTATSGVPTFVEDAGTIEQIARVLS